MITRPIVPIWLMIIICIIAVFLIIFNGKRILPRLLIIIMLFMINLRIMYPNGKGEIEVNNIELLFVVDNSISMSAEDYHGNTRFATFKNDCNYIINRLRGARYAFITFSNSSAIQFPFVNDPHLIKQELDIVKVRSSLDAKGSSLDGPYEDMEVLLKDSNSRKGQLTVLLFVSDGEITTEHNEVRSYAELKQYVDFGAVLGYGTESGGKMKADSYFSKDEKSSDGYILDKTNNYSMAISKLDEKNLKKIASDIGIDYIHMDKTARINDLLDDIITEAIKENEEAENIYEDTYYIYAIILLIILLWEYVYIRRSIK